MCVYPNTKIEHYCSIQSLHIVDSILGIAFSMPICSWPRPYEWTESNRCANVFVDTCKNLTSNHSSFSRYSWLVVLNHFGHTWPRTQANFYVCLNTSKKRKTNFKIQLLLEISWLTIWHHFGHPQTCLATLIWIDKINLLLLSMSSHIQKFNAMPPLICKIL